MIGHLNKQLIARPIVGLDIGSTVIKAVELNRSGDEILLRRASFKIINGKPHIAHLVKELFGESGFKTKRVAMAVMSPETVVHPFSFHHVPKKELVGAVRIEAEHAMLNNSSLHDMALDWQALDSGSENTRGLLAVTPKKIISQQTKMAKSIGLSPKVVDVGGLALWNAYWVLFGKKQNSSKTVLLLHIGAKTTHFALAKGPDELMLVRDIKLDTASLTSESKNHWVSELYDSLSYARSKAGLRTLDTVYVSGGGVSPDLLVLLEATLQVPVISWNILDFVTWEPGTKPIDRDLGPLFPIAFGLALRSL